ncbi:DoxX family protein [Nocardia cyriacigeorgica]|jgi:putative oxidoreductase|uniref:DoxX family protein n=1 Tax=Nocardia cyriacigeorgica TaxID=135487 RepID=UPI000CE9AFC2|nr:DoxX family protein [Nocardia cyriacigeorgica]PPJ06407.1 DoxX family protein [Nocardia cyriacigeorgica]
MTATVTAPATHRPGPIENIVLWSLQVVLCLFLVIASAYPKFYGHPYAIESYDIIGFGQWFRYFTGVVEVAGGIGLVVPRLVTPAAAGLVVTMVCAAATQAFLLEGPSSAIFPLVLGVIFAWIGWARRSDFAGLVASVRR